MQVRGRVMHDKSDVIRSLDSVGSAALSGLAQSHFGINLLKLGRIGWRYSTPVGADPFGCTIQLLQSRAI